LVVDLVVSDSWHLRNRINAHPALRDRIGINSK
jgi:hypothetical protein